MASLGLWKARMLLAQQRCNPEANRSMFTMRPLPKMVPSQPTKKHRYQNKQREKTKEIHSPLISNHLKAKKPEGCSVEQSPKIKQQPAAVSEERIEAPEQGRFGEGIIPEEELSRPRVLRHSSKNNRWVMLLEKDREKYERSLKEKMATKLQCQRNFGDTLRMQIKENAKRHAEEKMQLMAESELVIREVKEKAKEENMKKQKHREIVASNCLFIQEQLKLRQQAAEKAEQTRKRLDMLARESLQKKLEKEKLIAEEARRRIREDLQLNRAQNEEQMKERARMLAEERLRDMEEQRRNIAAMEATELAKQTRVKKIADKTAALEKESETIAQIIKQKQEEEERRIKRYQEECDKRDRQQEMERQKKQKAVIEDMKNSIKAQLEEGKKNRMIRAQEAERISISARDLAAQEMHRIEQKGREAKQRRRKYKEELDRQIRLKQQLNQVGFEDMDQNELAINKSLLE